MLSRIELIERLKHLTEQFNIVSEKYHRMGQDLLKVQGRIEEIQFILDNDSEQKEVEGVDNGHY